MAMKSKYSKDAPGKSAVSCLVVWVGEEKPKAPAGLDKAQTAAVEQALSLKDFKGSRGETHLVYTGDAKMPRLLLVGLGKVAELNREHWRRIAGKAAQALVKMPLKAAGVLLPEAAPKGAKYDLGEVLAEGMELGAYHFKDYKEPPKEKKDRLESLVFHDPKGISSAAAVRAGGHRAESICLARDLGNHPGNAMTPTELAKRAQQLAKTHQLKIKVLEEKDMERLGMGLLLGVARGSRQPPKLIVMEYRPPKAKGTLLYVGKGITFDTGGISLKPGAATDEMKFDMCGAAAVLGAMQGVALSKPNVNVVGIIPACENMPGGNATKPGDILKSFAGKQVEILNTDAEGRLVLADALAWGVKQYKPDGVVDLATLTGACVIALGHYATGAIGNDDAFGQRVVRAGETAGDAVWPLPNFDEYGEALKGKYGDLQNIGGREGGAITGGLFLKPFVDETPWMHLDIAGTAWGVKNIGHIPYDGATGVGVALLMDLAANWNAK